MDGLHKGCCSLEAKGASGGILLLWDSRVLVMVGSCIGIYSVSVIFQNVEDEVRWMYSGVYGPNDDGSRRVLWEELVGIFLGVNSLGVLKGISMLFGFLVSVQENGKS